MRAAQLGGQRPWRFSIAAGKRRFSMHRVLFAAVVALLAPAAGQGQPVTFNRDIAPVLAEHCWTCHRAGGTAPFSLVTYRDVSRRAEQIASVTARRIMPPWKPEPG